MPLPASYFGAQGITLGPKGKQLLLSGLVRQDWTNPAAGSLTAFLTTSAGPNTATNTAYRTGYQPAGNLVFDGALAAGATDFARNVVITVTHATAVVALSGTISGIDINGKQITEAWSVTAGTTSKTFTGKKGFARVDTVTIVAASDASADTVKIGTGNVFGLAAKNAVASAVKEVSAGSVVTNGTFVATSTATTDDFRGTYSPNTTPDGTKTYTVWIISDNPGSSADQ